MRIGTNHGSLSDRIMNRFGDSPRGMAESALEFLRIARTHDYHQMVLSMKSSNPKVMIEAYRLVVSLMNEEGMDYPLHLGVTEAGDGEDARIKSAIGIGSLLWDGLGDTLRVSLTEDPVAEIPVARDLAKRAKYWWEQQTTTKFEQKEMVNPYEFVRRTTPEIKVKKSALAIGATHVPAVLARASHPLNQPTEIIQEVARVQSAAKDAKVEGLLIQLENDSQLPHLYTLCSSLLGAIDLLVVDDLREDPASSFPKDHVHSPPILWHAANISANPASIARFLAHCEEAGHSPALSLPAQELEPGLVHLLQNSENPPVITLAEPAGSACVGQYRTLCAELNSHQLPLPLWIRNRENSQLLPDQPFFSAQLLDTAILSGSLCDGLGDLISVEHTGELDRNRALAYNTLQGARARISKTEFVPAQVVDARFLICKAPPNWSRMPPVTSKA